MRTIITVVGVSGSGKSYLIKTKILPSLENPIFIVDSQGEYSGGVVYESVTEIISAVQGRGWERANSSGRYILQAKNYRSIEALFQLVDSIGNCCLICDEAQTYFGTSGESEVLKNIVSTGRHRNISVIFAVRRFAELSRLATSQSNAIISFKQHEPNDIALIKKFGEAGAGVNELKQYDYIVLGTLPEGINL